MNRSITRSWIWITHGGCRYIVPGEAAPFGMLGTLPLPISWWEKIKIRNQIWQYKDFYELNSTMQKWNEYTHINVSNELANSAFNRWCTVRIHECRPTVPTVDMRKLIGWCWCCPLHNKSSKHSFSRQNKLKTLGKSNKQRDNLMKEKKSLRD